MRLLRSSIIAASLLLGAAACGEHEAAPPVASSPTMTARGLGPVPLCLTLDSVGPALGTLAAGSIRDSVFTGEDESRWPGRVITLARGGTAVFESSWADSARVWRISTDAPSVRTTHGAAVETAVGQLPAGSGPVAVELIEGQVVLSLIGDSVGAVVDTVAERALIEASGRSGRAPAVPPGARIRRLVVAGDCRVLAPAT